MSASGQGYVNECALASERFGEFLLYDRNDAEEARYKFDDALRLYKEWGATRKATILREKHQDLWRKPTEVVISPIES